MTHVELESILACPHCKTSLKTPKVKGKCKKCGFTYKKADGIWHFLKIEGEKTKVSAKRYDRMHRGTFFGPDDGSYEILAAFARGNKTVDIACGEGAIEKLAPETVAVEFSLNALKKAKKAGAKYLVLTNAQNLPFEKNAFDLSISAGSLEHFKDPQKAINEMARVSRIQILTVHKQLPFPLNMLGELATTATKIVHQPIEKPISSNNLEKMLKKAGLHIVFKGVWTLPVNYGRPIKFLPELHSLPSCHFVITIKQ